MTDKGKECILTWLKRAAGGGSFKRFDDLHVDEIEPDARERSMWLEKGLEYLSFAASARDAHQIPFVVTLAMGLGSSVVKKGITFNSKDLLEREIDDSPPSLYLFYKEQPEWISLSKVRVQIPGLQLPASMTCFFLEWKDDKQDLYIRSLSIAA